MNTEETVWPTNRTPSKAQIERLYRLAYTIDPAVFRNEDAVEFGIDVRRLKEFGEVRMSKSPGILRKHLHKLWVRMDSQQRAAFLMSYLIHALKGMEPVVADLEKVIGDVKDVRQAMDWIKSSLYSIFPRSLHKRLADGMMRWGDGNGGS